MAAASGDRPIQNVLGNPNDFNDLYRPPSVKVVFFNASAKISNTGAILILRIGSAASIPIASHERNLERYKIISRVPPSCITKQQIRRRPQLSAATIRRHHVSEEQMFGADEQVRHGGQSD